MPKATGSQAQVTYIAEVTPGTTPPTPAMKAVYMTGASPELAKEGYQSGDIRSDRQIVDFRHGFAQANMGLDVEMKHGEFDAFLESALFGTFTANVLKAGAAAQKTFSFEVGYTDIGQYHVLRGMRANSFNLSVTTDAVVTGSFAFVGNALTASGTTLDASPDAPGAKRSFDSFSGTINEGGSPIAIVTAIEMSLENSLEPAKVIGQSSPDDFFSGRCNVTGTLSAYFEDDSLLTKFRAETPSSIEFTLTDPDGATMTFLIPRVIYTGGTAPVDGEGGITIALPFQATYDPTEQTALKITRSA